MTLMIALMISKHTHRVKPYMYFGKCNWSTKGKCTSQQVDTRPIPWFVVVILSISFRRISPCFTGNGGNRVIALVPAKQPWRLWIKKSKWLVEVNNITTAKQLTSKACVYIKGYIVANRVIMMSILFSPATSQLVIRKACGAIKYGIITAISFSTKHNKTLCML